MKKSLIIAAVIIMSCAMSFAGSEKNHKSLKYGGANADKAASVGAMPTATLIMGTAFSMGLIISYRQALEILLCVAEKIFFDKSLKIAVKECLCGHWFIEVEDACHIP